MNNEQMSLPFTLDEDSLRKYIEKASGRTVSMVLTDNSISMLSIKAAGIDVCLRINRMFLSAGIDVIAEVAEFIAGRRRRTPVIRRFIRENANLLQKTPRRKVKTRTAGRHHDLKEMYTHLNREYFGGRIFSNITWGEMRPGRLVRKRTLGSYSSHTDTIRINPVMDKKSVPRYFIEFVVYHEMLHADMGTEKRNNRRSVHPREFKMRERLFRDYEKAVAWERAHGV